MCTKIVSAVVLLALVLGAAAPAAAQAPAEKPVRVLFVGDCHSWFLDTYFAELAASGDPPIAVLSGSGYWGGWGLEELWTLGKGGRPDLAALLAGEGKWDFGVIDIGHACKAPDSAEYTDWVPKWDEAFKKAGARTVLVTVWPDRDDIDTEAEYVAVDQALAARLGARVAPVGTAVERVRKERPELIEYVDEYHVNGFGWYLQMCVLYASLFDRSPEGLTYRMTDNARPSDGNPGAWSIWHTYDGFKLSDADATYLQQVAWETVQQYREVLEAK